VKRGLKFELLNVMNSIISLTFEPLEKLVNLRLQRPHPSKAVRRKGKLGVEYEGMEIIGQDLLVVRWVVLCMFCRRMEMLKFGTLERFVNNRPY
jgi:hypothetical protein